MDFIRRYFLLAENRTSIRTELSAGLTTFLTMAYILFVQPQVLSAAGMNSGAVFTATCLSSALACLVMGLAANYPIAQAPLMGENFFFAYTVVLTMGLSWQKALGLVFISGIVFLLFNITHIRELLINSIPDSLTFGISAGIGLFVSFIGLKEAGIVIPSPASAVQLGPITELPVLVALIGLLVTAILLARGVRGSILLGMLASGLLAWEADLIRVGGLLTAPPSLAPTFMQFDLSGLLTWHSMSIVLIFLFMTIFDTVGTLVGVGMQAGLMKDGKLPRAPRALFADALGTTAGACLGTSTVSSYIESATGVAQGGRTGLTAVTVGLLFLLALFFSPIVGAVGAAVKISTGQMIHPVTAPALIVVGALMMSAASRINWEDVGDSLPSFLVMVLIPFTYNIADGMAAGFISYPILKAAQRRAREVTPLMWMLCALFIARYAFLR
ncbi:MAG: NCS2 family permease [Elusimicrobia bacterium]|nr:NCS2 family permease [Elusimicrobiota bacterium]